MAYCALIDMKKLIPEETLVQLTDDENTGAIDSARIDESIIQADDEINAYLGTLYDIPLSPVPAIVKKLSVDMAIYHLYSRRMETIPETRAERYKHCLEILEGMAAGKISAGAATEPSGNIDLAEISSHRDRRIFTRRKMRGF